MTNYEKYDRRMIHLFDVVGSYFIDVLYNKHLAHAKSLVHNGKSKSVTDAYRGIINSYVDGISQQPKNYAMTVQKLHEYYKKVDKNSFILLSEFEDKFLAWFIPTEYFKDLTNSNKDTILRDIIMRVVYDLGMELIKSDVLSAVIDRHGDPEDIILLQDRVQTNLILQRENYFSKFARELMGKKAPQPSIQDLENLKAAFMAEKRRSVTAENDKERLVNLLKSSMEQLRAANAKNEQLTRENNQLLQENNKLLQENRQLTQENNQLPAKLNAQIPKLQPPIVKIEKLNEKPTEKSTENSLETPNNLIFPNVPKNEPTINLLNFAISDDPWNED